MGAYLHSLAQSRREQVAIDEALIAEAVDAAGRALAAIRGGAFPARASQSACAACDYARVCRHCDKGVRAALQEWG